MTQSRDDNHYSYKIYADPATAEEFDRSHFGGPIGAMIAEVQEHVILDFLGDLRDASMLDVGTGTGRAALMLAKQGARVTALDVSPEMLKVAQMHAADANLEVEFMTGDAHDLNFPDRSFDTVISLRVLMHTPDWRRCLSEMCRVSSRRVVFDYPPFVSAAVFQVVARRAAQAIGRRVEAYHVLRTDTVCSVLSAQGFRVARLHRQFVLPIAFHKMIGSRHFTESVEKFLATIGLLRVMGAPVTIVAERCESS